MRVIIALAFIVALAAAQSGISIVRGTTGDPGISGWVTFVTNAANSSMVDVTVSVSGITVNPDAEHGIHVHQWGDISDPTGNAAGAHFALPGEVHGCPGNENRHTGDMGNWTAVAGVINMTKTMDKLRLTGATSIIGRAVIIHATFDDCVTQPTGNSSSRLAQGVIGIMNMTGNTASNGMARTTNGMDAAMCFLVPIAGRPVNITGYGLITQAATGGVWVVVQLAGVNNSVHATHIHEFGDLRSDLAVGSHWNPSASPRHGMYGYPAHHTGDLGNIYLFQDPPTNSKPAANFTQWTNNSFNVVGGDFNVVGTALVIHMNRDDCSNPIGMAGARYSTCVWGLVNPNLTLSVFNPPMPSGLTTNYDAITKAACDAQFNITSTSSSSSSSTGGGATATTTGSSSTGSAAMIVFSAITILAAMLF